jgi:hypothetical protein
LDGDGAARDCPTPIIELLDGNFVKYCALAPRVISQLAIRMQSLPGAVPIAANDDNSRTG